MLSVTSLMLMGISKSYANYALQRCHEKWSSCTQRCGNLYSGTDFLQSCLSRCDGGLNTCLDAVDESQGKVETPPDPVRPKGTGNHTPPIGGTKDEPKVPSKVNDTRAPRSDGVFHPKSSGSTPPPILLKSNGGNGPSFRSHGRH
jgi:hypothetical protein